MHASHKSTDMHKQERCMRTWHAPRTYLDVGAELVDEGEGRLSDDAVVGRPLGGNEWCRSWPERGGAF